jgi:hypothetical protein
VAQRRGYVKRVLLAIILAAAAIWSLDWLILRTRIATGGNAFGSVPVRRRFEVHLKGKRIEQDLAKPEVDDCVRSIFSHYDDLPCWYLERHKDQVLDVDSSPWHFWAQ